jgi:hypothetical protein
MGRKSSRLTEQHWYHLKLPGTSAMRDIKVRRLGGSVMISD